MSKWGPISDRTLRYIKDSVDTAIRYCWWRHVCTCWNSQKWWKTQCGLFEDFLKNVISIFFGGILNWFKLANFIS